MINVVFWTKNTKDFECSILTSFAEGISLMQITRLDELLKLYSLIIKSIKTKVTSIVITNFSFSSFLCDFNLGITIFT